jgi:hypothetical protein
MTMPMEGSMRTMSWSRYHCLSWLMLRLRMRVRAKRAFLWW